MRMLAARGRFREWISGVLAGLLGCLFALPIRAEGVGFDGLEDHPLLDQPAPAFREVDAWIGGPPVSLAELQGRIVVVEFFSLETWDTSFQGSEEAIDRFLEKWAESGVTFVGIAPDDASSLGERVRSFRGEAHIASDGDLLNYTAYQAQALGQSFILDRRGIVRWTGFPDVGRSKWSAAVSQLVEEEREAQLASAEESLAEAERRIAQGRAAEAVPLLATVRDRAPRAQLRSRARRALEELAREGEGGLAGARELRDAGRLVRAAEEAQRVARTYAGTPVAAQARALADEILDDPRFLSVVRAEGEGREPSVAWFGNWSRALREARRRNVPLVIAFNMDGEPANEQMAWLVYRDPAFVEAARDAVLVLASPDTHEETVVESPGGTRRICQRFGSVSCREHQRVEVEVRKKVLGGVSWVFAPQHVFLSPRGEFLFRRESTLGPHEFARLLVHARRGEREVPGGLPLPEGGAGEKDPAARSGAGGTDHVVGGVELHLPAGMEAEERPGELRVRTPRGPLRILAVEMFPAGRAQVIGGAAVDGRDAGAVARAVWEGFGRLHPGMLAIEAPRRGTGTKGAEEIWSFRARPDPGEESEGGTDPMWIEVFVTGTRGVHRLRVVTSVTVSQGERNRILGILASIHELGKRG